MFATYQMEGTIICTHISGPGHIKVQINMDFLFLLLVRHDFEAVLGHLEHSFIALFSPAPLQKKPKVNKSQGSRVLESIFY